MASSMTGPRRDPQSAHCLREQARQLDAAVKATPETQPMPTLDELALNNVTFPRRVLVAAAEALRCEANGEEPEIVVVRQTLSTQQAADLLGVSRPHLTLLLDRERVPYTTTPGGHRRIKHADLEAYRARRDQAHGAMRDAMTAADDLADGQD